MKQKKIDGCATHCNFGITKPVIYLTGIILYGILLWWGPIHVNHVIGTFCNCVSGHIYILQIINWIVLHGIPFLFGFQKKITTLPPSSLNCSGWFNN
jgi:hypothetical protein